MTKTAKMDALFVKYMLEYKSKGFSSQDAYHEATKKIKNMTSQEFKAVMSKE